MFSTLGSLLHPLRSVIQRAPIQSNAWRMLSTTQKVATDIAADTTNITKTAAAVTFTAPSSSSPNVEPDKLYSKLEIELKGNDPAVLKSYSFFASTAAQHLDIEVGKSWALRKAQHNRFVLLKSVHIYKKHRVHYEIRTYYRFLHLHRLTGSTLATYLEYIERNMPEGVAMKATRVERQALPEHLQSPPECVV